MEAKRSLRAAMRSRMMLRRNSTSESSDKPKPAEGENSESPGPSWANNINSSQKQMHPHQRPLESARQRPKIKLWWKKVRSPLLSRGPPDARDANFDSGNEDDGQPPTKKTKSVQKPVKSKG